jgi:hypothetical protein
MSEIVMPNKSEEYWHGAINSGLDETTYRLRHQENVSFGYVSGAAFEYLGTEMMRDLFRKPDYHVTGVLHPYDWISSISEADDQRYDPRFPDALLFMQKTPNSLRLDGFIEYKIPDLQARQLGKHQRQYLGFQRLHDLLRIKGKDILQNLLEMSITNLEILPNMPFYYVVPSDRTALNISDAGKLKQIKFPMTGEEITRRLQFIANEQFKAHQKEK